MRSAPRAGCSAGRGARRARRSSSSHASTPSVVDALREAGHAVEVVGAFEEMMGHAGAIVHHPHGVIEGAADPRSDGGVAAF